MRAGIGASPPSNSAANLVLLRELIASSVEKRKEKKRKEKKRKEKKRKEKKRKEKKRKEKKRKEKKE